MHFLPFAFKPMMLCIVLYNFAFINLKLSLSSSFSKIKILINNDDPSPLS